MSARCSCAVEAAPSAAAAAHQWRKAGESCQLMSAPPSPGTIHTLYTIYSDTEIHPGGFMLGRTDYSATQRRRATIFRPATAAAHLTYDRHISERQSLNTIFTRVNPSIKINCVQRAVVRVAQRAARLRRRRQSSRPRHRRQPPSVTRNSSTWFWGEGRHTLK